MSRIKVAALFVETDGVYYGLPTVDPWDEERDARKYNGPYPVVAHPPCERWSKFWHGSTVKPHQYKLGEDQGCFASALTAVRNYGGVLEHPAYSKAWEYFGLIRPTMSKGWTTPDIYGGRSCYVEQCHYGHIARKATWLYVVGSYFPKLNWSKGQQRLHPTALKKHGYEKARKIGIISMVGGKDKKKIRNATPKEFRNVLIKIAKRSTL